MRLAAYLRVSTDTQAEHGLGLEVQRDAILEWAHAHDHRIGAWFSDEGKSGSNGLEERAGLADAIAAVRELDGLVVYRLDRLARDLIVQEQLLADLRRMGAAVFSTAAGEDAYLKDDPDDPSRKLIRQVLGAVAEYERSMIALRLRSGRARKHANGGYAYGAPPYGYRAVDGELVPNGDELEVIALMRQWRSEGESYRAIAEHLEKRYYPTRHGGDWHPDTVRRILERENVPGGGRTGAPEPHAP